MLKFPRQRTFLVVLAFSIFATFAMVATANHSWGGYHWARTSNPFTLKLGNNLSTTNWRSRLTQAASDWNAGGTPVRLSVVTGTAGGSACNMVAGTIQVCNGSYGANGWLGLASINLRTGTKHITQGTAKMNDTYFNTTTYNNVNERQHVMCQEVAHCFGLDHQSTSGASLNTCMDYFSNTGANAGSTLSTKPNQHDFDQLNSIYSHLDTTSTVGRVASFDATFSDVTDDPGSWGYLKSQSENGRSSVYERYNGDGSKTLTHVFWTEEAAARNPHADHRYDH
jgi:hypothetical protein